MSAIAEPILAKREALPVRLKRENPYGLVSLWDMVRIYAVNFVRIGARFERCAVDHRSIVSPDEQVSDLMRSRFYDLVDTLRLDANDLDLDHTPEFTEAFAEKSASSLTYRELSVAAENIHRIYQSELRKRLFLTVSSQRAKYFEKLDGLTDGASRAFPSSAPEIRDAGNCYALEQDTASVMHSMRALESPLCALAKEFNVDIGRDQWHKIIANIENAIAGLSQASGVNWRNLQESYAPSCKEFRYFKDAWRNHAMHAKLRYDSAEAKRALDHAVVFLEDLSRNGLHE